MSHQTENRELRAVTQLYIVFCEPFLRHNVTIGVVVVVSSATTTIVVVVVNVEFAVLFTHDRSSHNTGWLVGIAGSYSFGFNLLHNSFESKHTTMISVQVQEYFFTTEFGASVNTESYGIVPPTKASLYI